MPTKYIVRLSAEERGDMSGNRKTAHGIFRESQARADLKNLYPKIKNG